MVFRFLRRAIGKLFRRKERPKKEHLPERKISFWAQMEKKQKHYRELLLKRFSAEELKNLILNPKAWYWKQIEELACKISDPAEREELIRVIGGFTSMIYNAYTSKDLDGFLTEMSSRAMKDPWKYAGEGLALEFIKAHREEFEKGIRKAIAEAETVRISPQELTRAINAIETRTIKATRSLENERMKLLYEAARFLAASAMPFKSVEISEEALRLLRNDPEFRKKAEELAKALKQKYE